MARKKNRPGEEISPGDLNTDAATDPDVEGPETPTSEHITPTLPPEPPRATLADPSQFTAPLERRIEELERSVAPLQQLDGIEERLLQRMSHLLVPSSTIAPQPPPAASHSLIPGNATFSSVGKQLLHSVFPTHQDAPSPHATEVRPWPIRELLADMLAMIYMFVDPRYRLSWVGRTFPLALLILFLTSEWWSGLFFGWLFRKPVEFVLCFALVKILGYEARRYRETAPNLPPSLRL